MSSGVRKQSEAFFRSVQKKKRSAPLHSVFALLAEDVHELENVFDDIQIRDKIFERILKFFDQLNWHLDMRTETSGKDNNPDVIRYIFERRIARSEDFDYSEIVSPNPSTVFTCSPKGFADTG